MTAYVLDPLLLELFESVHQDLAQALEKRERLSEVAGEDHLAKGADHARKIEKLKVAMAALEGALDRRGNGIVH